MKRPEVLILGGGFGGLKAARALKNAEVNLTLVDKTNHHLFQPLLYQVATCALSTRDIAFPIREILKHQSNTKVIMDEAVKIDPDQKIVHFESGRELKFDVLIVAIGAHFSYFGHDDWKPFAPGLKTIEDAQVIRNNILKAYEKAEVSTDPKEIEKLLTFIVIGGGTTGVELAGAIAEIARKTLSKNFRHIDPKGTKVYLIEMKDHILPTYPADLGEHAKEDLEQMGVTVKTGTAVDEIHEDGVETSEGKICSENVIWAAGNQAPKLLEDLKAPLDQQKRVLVEEDLSIPGYPEIFVIGDAAHVDDESGAILPGLAPVAIQQGQYVGKLIARGLDKKRKPFRYKDRGIMATIGKAKAVAVIGDKHFTGLFAWLLWSLVHITFLVGFRNRFIVMLEWLFWYITEKRGSRLIH